MVAEHDHYQLMLVQKYNWSSDHVNANGLLHHEDENVIELRHNETNQSLHDTRSA